MSYVTEKLLEDKIDVPIQLPATELLAGNWLVVTCIRIPTETLVTLSLRFLQLKLLELVGSEADCTVPEDVNVKLGLFQDFNGQASPDSQTAVQGEILQSAVPAPSTVERDFATTLRLEEPGTYSWVVWTDSNAKLAVTGAVRVDVNPS